jgi:hypothetical protein
MNKRTEDELEKTLEVVGSIKKAEMPPFFYTRLKARMENEKLTSGKPVWILKPAFAISLLIITMAINGLTLKSFVQKNANKSSSINAKEVFLNEYNIKTSYGVNLY